MRKILFSILAVLYFGLSTGATIHMHYCMGKLVESALWHNSSKVGDKCSNCGMSNKKSKCCKDEHKHLQIEKDQKANDLNSQNFSFSEVQILNTPFFEYKTAIRNSLFGLNSYANAPPDNLFVPIYIRIQVFRI